jgi:hypothetical protein
MAALIKSKRFGLVDEREAIAIQLSRSTQVLLLVFLFSLTGSLRAQVVPRDYVTPYLLSSSQPDTRKCAFLLSTLENGQVLVHVSAATGSVTQWRQSEIKKETGKFFLIEAIAGSLAGPKPAEGQLNATPTGRSVPEADSAASRKSAPPEVQSNDESRSPFSSSTREMDPPSSAFPGPSLNPFSISARASAGSCQVRRTASPLVVFNAVENLPIRLAINIGEIRSGGSGFFTTERDLGASELIDGTVRFRPIVVSPTITDLIGNSNFDISHVTRTSVANRFLIVLNSREISPSGPSDFIHLFFADFSFSDESVKVKLNVASSLDYPNRNALLRVPGQAVAIRFDARGWWVLHALETTANSSTSIAERLYVLEVDQRTPRQMF